MSVDFIRGKWRARISINRKRFELGRFDTKEAAAARYAAALEENEKFRVRSPRPCKDPVERFFGKTSRADNGCLLWNGAKDKDGYGKFQINGGGRQKHIRAHRYAFFVANGIWPSELVLHSCDTPSCVNPLHLSEGNQLRNVRECVARGRHRAGRVGRRRKAA